MTCTGLTRVDSGTGQTGQGHSRVFCSKSSLLRGIASWRAVWPSWIHVRLQSRGGSAVEKENFHSFARRSETFTYLPRRLPIKQRRWRWRRPHQVTFAASGHPFGAGWKNQVRVPSSDRITKDFQSNTAELGLLRRAQVREGYERVHFSRRTALQPSLTARTSNKHIKHESARLLRNS